MNENPPSAPVTPSRGPSGPATVTTTPGSAPSFASTMKPSMDPRGWAAASAEDTSSRATGQIIERSVTFIDTHTITLEGNVASTALSIVDSPQGGRTD